VHVAARQHLGDLVADQFTDAQLALRAAGGLFALMMAGHFYLLVMPEPGPGIHVQL
jgi:hypothetical protein